MDFSITFTELFLRGLVLFSPIILLFGVLILVLGLVVGRIESWGAFDAVYWAFVTGLTVGYGDLRPTQRLSRVLAVVIAVLGIMLAGILVALTVETASQAFRTHADPAILERLSTSPE